VKEAVQKSRIDLIIPLHEEIFYLASCEDKQILDLLFAPKFDILYRLHNKWTFSALMLELGFDIPEAHLCKSADDVRALDKNKEWAVKPILGRGSTGVHHLHTNRKDGDLPTIHVSDESPHIAQEWIRGKRYCSYGVFREGVMQALGIYPVLETLDGSASVYFQAIEHAGIRDYVHRIAEILKITGQLAFDFVETEFESKVNALAHETEPMRDRGSSSSVTIA
jgi:carbamoylphosphate synthase large subunit